jgi:hypothetical protein
VGKFERGGAVPSYNLLAVNFYVDFQFSESARSFVDDFSKTQQTGKDILTTTTFYHQNWSRNSPNSMHKNITTETKSGN